MENDRITILVATCAGLTGALGGILFDALDTLMGFEQWGGSVVYAVTVAVLVYEILLRWTQERMTKED